MAHKTPFPCQADLFSPCRASNVPYIVDDWLSGRHFIALVSDRWMSYFDIWASVREFKTDCPQPFLKITTPDPEGCSSHWTPQSLVTKSRKLDGIGPFNLCVLSEVAAADSSELWLQLRDTHCSGSYSTSSPLPGRYSCPAATRLCFGLSRVIWSKGESLYDSWSTWTWRHAGSNRRLHVSRWSFLVSMVSSCGVT